MNRRAGSVIFFLSLCAILLAVASSNASYDTWRRNPVFDVFYKIWQVLFKIPTLAPGIAKFLGEMVQFDNREMRDSTPAFRQEYDFIIVGAGAAGATLARRLTEIPSVSVLLIEAGDKENLILDIPVAAIPNQLYKPVDWGFKTEPSNRYCTAFENNQCLMFQGKVMGGTSVVNAMLGTRGNRRDYDNWAKLTGDSSWNYDNMLRYFKKLETHDVQQPEVNPALHGYNGPMRIANPPYRSPLGTAFVQAGMEMGYPKVDYNGYEQRGFGYIQANLINGERNSVNRAYLHPIRDRSNLRVTMRSFVTKVLIDPTTRTAKGVEFIKNGRKIEVLARRDVILTAGAINTPKLLMLSGIGPADHLRQFGIKVLQDAPVGMNLMDHITYSGTTFLINQTYSIVITELIRPENPVVNNFLLRRTGPLTMPSGVEGMGYLNVDENGPPNEITTEFMFLSLGFLSDSLIYQLFGMKRDFFEGYFGPDLHHHAWSIWPLLMQPKSKGRILLRSADPAAKPRIIPNYYSDPEDVRIAVKAVRKVIELSRTPAMQRLGSRQINRQIPGCEQYGWDSDAYWECALRAITISMWHFCGTAKMGSELDPSAVVNTEGRVKGIRNLRVADASVFPYIPRAHTHLPTIATAEKFADVIKRDWGYIN